MQEDYFRKQYFIGTEDFGKLDGWNKFKINKKLFVYTHPDLEVNQYFHKNNNIILLGFFINPCKKNYSNLEILKDICIHSKDFDDVLRYTYPLSGRWLIIFDNNLETKIVNDLIGLRELYYTIKDGEVWCGTDPKILNYILDLEKKTDKELHNYIESSYFKKSEHAWYGSRTLYKNTFHMLPNHYFDLRKKNTQRYWINEEEAMNFEEAVQTAARILKHSLEAANERYDLMLAVTAGLDSRVLLAASKNISNEVYYFVSQENMRTSHMDIRIPSKLLPRLNLKLNLIKNVAPLRHEFEQKLQNNISLFRKGHHRNTTTQYYYDHLNDKMNVNGIVSEIGRFRYGNNHPPEQSIDSKYLMELVGCPSDNKFVSNEIDKWLSDAKEFSKETNFGLTNLFYWEQVMGNWGCLTVNEEDIATESYMPFNNRKLLMIINSVDSKYHQSPEFKFHKEMIKELWPEALSEPINPDSNSRMFLKKVLPSKFIKAIKKIIN